MDNFDQKFLCSLVKHYKKIDLSSNILLQSGMFISDVFVLEALDLLIKKTHKEALDNARRTLSIDNLDEEKVDLRVQSEEFNLYCIVIREAIIHWLTEPTDTTDEVINFILKTDFCDIVQEFKSRSSFSLYMMRHYILYIFKRNSGLLKDKEIDEIFKKYTWLEELFFSKGYSTINDKARKVLLDMHEALENIDAQKADINKVLDDYFSDGKNNIFLKREFPGMNDEKEILAFKRYQFRLIVADSYLALKSWDIMRNESDVENPDDPQEYRSILIDYLEDFISDGDYELLRDLETVHQLYGIFFTYNSQDYYRELHSSLLGANDCLHILKKANCLYFMD